MVINDQISIMAFIDARVSGILSRYKPTLTHYELSRYKPTLTHYGLTRYKPTLTHYELTSSVSLFSITTTHIHNRVYTSSSPHLAIHPSIG